MVGCGALVFRSEPVFNALPVLPLTGGACLFCAGLVSACSTSLDDGTAGASPGRRRSSSSERSVESRSSWRAGMPRTGVRPAGRGGDWTSDSSSESLNRLRNRPPNLGPSSSSESLESANRDLNREPVEGFPEARDGDDVCTFCGFERPKLEMEKREGDFDSRGGRPISIEPVRIELRIPALLGAAGCGERDRTLNLFDRFSPGEVGEEGSPDPSLMERRIV